MKSKGNQVLSVESHRTCFLTPAMSVVTPVKYRQTAKVMKGPVPRIFIRGRSRRQPMPGTCQNSRLQEGKLVFSRNHIVFMSSLGAVRAPLSVRWLGTLLKSKSPKASPRPTSSEAFLKISSQDCSVDSFLHKS